MSKTFTFDFPILAPLDEFLKFAEQELDLDSIFLYRPDGGLLAALISLEKPIKRR